MVQDPPPAYLTSRRNDKTIFAEGGNWDIFSTSKEPLSSEERL